MNWSELPPLNALKAFAAFAETGSATGAGAALNVTHAAVSQQLRTLETHLGVSLLDRRGKTMSLTPEGQELAEVLRLSFSAIASATEKLTEADQSRPLQVSMTPTFASGWLLPRLADFRRAHPEVDLMLNPTPELAPLVPGGIDVAIRYGNGDWPGLASHPLLPSSTAIVAAPSLVKPGEVTVPADLLNYPWVQELGVTEARDWLNRQGVTDALVSGLVELPGNLMIDAARAGQGIAVTARALIEDDLAAGRLLLLFEDRSKIGYFIVTRPGFHRASLQKFERWLRRQRKV